MKTSATIAASMTTTRRMRLRMDCTRRPAALSARASCEREREREDDRARGNRPPDSGGKNVLVSWVTKLSPG